MPRASIRTMRFTSRRVDSKQGSVLETLHKWRGSLCVSEGTQASSPQETLPTWPTTLWQRDRAPCHQLGTHHMSHGKERCLTQVLPVGPFIALHVEQRVAVVNNLGPWRAQWLICCLTVPGHKEAMVHRWGAGGTHRSWQPFRAWWAR